MNRPLWMKIFGGIVILALVAIGVLIFLGRKSVSAVTPAFIERRNDIARALKELSTISDVDLSQLSGLENRRDWIVALQTISGVIEKNQQVVSLIESLVEKTRLLTLEAQNISNQQLRDRALLALVDLESGNDAMLIYFRLRAKVFRSIQQYYADLIAGKTSLPPNLDRDLSAIDEYILKAKASYRSFNQRIEEFDRAAGLRYQGSLLFLS